MNDDQYLLASAYLDGELSADDRVRAAADPEVMAVVEQLRALAGDITDIDPPAPATRDHALGAALAEFRSTPTARRPLGTWLGVAAAAVAVLAVGAVVVPGLRGGDDDGGDDAAQTMEMVAADADAEVTAEVTAEPLEAIDSDLTGDGEIVTLAEAPADRAAEEPLSPSMAEEQAGGVASTFDAFDAADTAPPSAPFDLAAPLANLNDLSAYGDHLLVLEAQGDLPPTPNTHCPRPDATGVVDVLDTAVYVVDDTAVAVLIAVDRVAGLTLALDPNTCEVVADNRLP